MNAPAVYPLRLEQLRAMYRRLTFAVQAEKDPAVLAALEAARTAIGDLGVLLADSKAGGA